MHLFPRRYSQGSILRINYLNFVSNALVLEIPENFPSCRAVLPPRFISSERVCRSSDSSFLILLSFDDPRLLSSRFWDWLQNFARPGRSLSWNVLVTASKFLYCEAVCRALSCDFNHRHHCWQVVRWLPAPCCGVCMTLCSSFPLAHHVA